MTKRTPGEQARFRRATFDAHKKADERGHIFLVCHICGGKIDPARERWEADHMIARAFGGTEGAPVHVACHREKTSKDDVPAIAKSKRVRDKHYGVRKRSAFRRPPEGYDPWKRRMKTDAD